MFWSACKEWHAAQAPNMRWPRVGLPSAAKPCDEITSAAKTARALAQDPIMLFSGDGEECAPHTIGPCNTRRALARVCSSEVDWGSTRQRDTDFTMEGFSAIQIWGMEGFLGPFGLGHVSFAVIMLALIGLLLLAKYIISL
jgi:hypothetical protein